MQQFSKGFTLVELLIVMAIIAILASVVFPRLQTARDEGIETKIKTELTVVGKRASVEENQALTYDIVCGTNGFAQAPSIASQIQVVEEFTGESVVCNSQTESYAVAVLVASSTYWCVDSEGKRLERATTLGASEYACE
jgi:prepilin-type N-terminal cleavage/methylation domain-containing protein